ncbi:MAG TPA: SDR family NAD(P)-dependent oxidoreductase [Planctomycetaceae bacterium]|nr:SDR family NAD(P)-dependent oxidoreductase [Planctomycetaceae bacterium]
MTFFSNKTVLVTGGCGTVGREIVRQLLDHDPKELRVVDTNESEIFFLEQELADHRRRNSHSTVSSLCQIGDIRDADKLNMMCSGVDIVLHTAALKHVILCERAPFDAVQTNIMGVKNVIQAALTNDVERVIFTSSDKAVNPTNVMGTSKLMGERLITAANSLKMNRRTIFSSTRFGNVLGSRGSVIPIFARQIEAGGPVTLTDRRMTRFIMTLEESCRLVLSAAEKARGGEVFVTKMPVIQIADLARVMIDELAPQHGYSAEKMAVTEIGSKPGEKLYEELMSDEETRRTVELTEMFSVLPAFRSVYEDIAYDYADIVNSEVTDPYVSTPHNSMPLESLRDFCLEHDLLAPYLRNTIPVSAARHARRAA